jgi:hypothetical protein
MVSISLGNASHLTAKPAKPVDAILYEKKRLTADKTVKHL